MLKIECAQAPSKYPSAVPVDTPERKLVEFIFQKCKKDFNVRLSDRTLLAWTHHPRFTLVINDPGIFRELLFRPDDLTLGRAFIDKRIDLEGDVLEIMRLEKNPGAFDFTLREKFVLLSLVLRV